ncbi:MAG: NAD(P)-dependent oxidoreductase [Pirellulaceae bacterium]
MKIAVTGATGFIGRYLVRHLLSCGHQLQCWCRPSSDLSGFPDDPKLLEWIPGALGETAASEQLVSGCDAVIHAALWRPGAQFRGGEGDLIRFTETNVLGTLRLIEAARRQDVPRFVFISTCAVHEVILADRLLDESHPLWPNSHYGAHKAAIEKFVHSYGLGEGYDICSLRPTGVYGLRQPASHSKWFDLIQDVARGNSVDCQRGGKEVHAADVARAAELLLHADGIAGQSYNCYDQYISQWDVAQLAKEISASRAVIGGTQTTPLNEIENQKIRQLGMTFGGPSLLQQTVKEILAAPTTSDD